MHPPWAIVCDFDGTALAFDLGDRVACHFAGEEAYRAAEDGYHAGEYNFGELLRRIFSPITATREEIGEFARKIAKFRPGFEPFVSACRAGGSPVFIVSSGLDAYVEPALAMLPPPVRGHLEVRTNHAIMGDSGLVVRFHGSDCGFCGFCKGYVVEELKAAGHRVVLIGDGTGDRHAALAAHHVFARTDSSLARYLTERRVPFDPFDSFFEVMDRFPAKG